MRAWVRTDRLTGLGLTTGDIINAIQAQNVQAAVGRIGARPISDDQQLQLNIQTKGRLTSGRGVREHRRAHQSRRIGAAPARRRARGARRRQPRPRDAAERRPGRRDRRSTRRPAPTRSPRSRPSASRIAELRKALPRGSGLEGHLRPDELRHRDDRRGEEDAGRGLRPGGARGLPVPRQLARDADPDARRAGQPDRHLHRAQGRSAIRPTRSRCWRSCWPSASSSTTRSSWSRTSSG